MKEFKLFDKEWLENHISVSIEEVERRIHSSFGASFTAKDYYYVVDFKDMHLVDTYSEITAKEFYREYMREISSKYSKIVFRKESTGEYYWFDLKDAPVENAYLFDKYRCKYIVKGILEHIVKTFDIDTGKRYMEKDIKVKMTSIDYDVTDARTVIEDWLVNTFKISKELLSNTSLSFVIDHCKTLSVPKVKQRKINLINGAIAGEVSNKELDNYIEEKNNFIIKCLNENKESIYIKYTLFRNDIAFSGSYKVNFLNEKRYKNKPKTFDAIAIDIGVMGGIEYTRETIVSHKNEVLKVIWTILKIDPSTKKYAKFMKLSKLKILNDGCLYAQFDFKDGLEEALSGGLEFGA